MRLVVSNWLFLIKMLPNQQSFHSNEIIRDCSEVDILYDFFEFTLYCCCQIWMDRFISRVYDIETNLLLALQCILCKLCQRKWVYYCLICVNNIPIYLVLCVLFYLPSFCDFCPMLPVFLECPFWIALQFIIYILYIEWIWMASRVSTP